MAAYTPTPTRTAFKVEFPAGAFNGARLLNLIETYATAAGFYVQRLSNTGYDAVDIQPRWAKTPAADTPKFAVLRDKQNVDNYYLYAYVGDDVIATLALSGENKKVYGSSAWWPNDAVFQESFYAVFDSAEGFFHLFKKEIRVSTGEINQWKLFSCTTVDQHVSALGLPDNLRMPSFGVAEMGNGFCPPFYARKDGSLETYGWMATISPLSWEGFSYSPPGDCAYFPKSLSDLYCTGDDRNMIPMLQARINHVKLATNGSGWSDGQLLGGGYQVFNPGENYSLFPAFAIPVPAGGFVNEPAVAA